MKTRILTTAKGMKVETPYTNAEAIQRLRDVPGTFAADLLVKAFRYPDPADPAVFRYNLSADQTAWVHKLVLDHEARRRPTTTVQPTRRYDRITELFRHAAEHKSYPKIWLTLADGSTLKMSLCGAKSKNAGAVNLTDDGSYPDNRYYGRINPEGYLSGGMPAMVRELLDAFEADPAAVAKAQSQGTVRCIFCGLELDTHESRTQGYGPVCATNWGLPWDQANNRTAPRKRTRKAKAEPTRQPDDESRQLDETPAWDETYPVGRYLGAASRN